MGVDASGKALDKCASCDEKAIGYLPEFKETRRGLGLRRVAGVNGYPTTTGSRPGGWRYRNAVVTATVAMARSSQDSSDEGPGLGITQLGAVAMRRSQSSVEDLNEGVAVEETFAPHGLQVGKGLGCNSFLGGFSFGL